MSVRFCIKDRRPLASHFVQKSCGELTMENNGESSSENEIQSKNDARPQLTFVEILDFHPVLLEKSQKPPVKQRKSEALRSVQHEIEMATGERQTSVS